MVLHGCDPDQKPPKTVQSLDFPERETDLLTAWHCEKTNLDSLTLKVLRIGKQLTANQI